MATKFPTFRKVSDFSRAQVSRAGRDGIDMVLETREWQEAMRQFVEDSGKDTVESINRSMKQIIWRAPYSLVMRTQRQTPGGIRGDLSFRRKGDLLERIATKWLVKKGIRATQLNVAGAMKKILDARVRHVKYIIAGWAPAARMFEATRINLPGQKSRASKGYGTRATIRNPEAVAVNAVGGEIKDDDVYAHAVRTMRLAVVAESRNLATYLGRKNERNAKKHSGNSNRKP